MIRPTPPPTQTPNEVRAAALATIIARCAARIPGASPTGTVAAMAGRSASNADHRAADAVLRELKAIGWS